MKPSDFTINVQEMADYEFEHRMAAVHGRGTNKSLEAVIRHKIVKYRVMSQKELVLETSILVDAVDAFNEA